MAAILLTGASGYLGSAVAARLDALDIAWESLPDRLEHIAPGSLPHTRVIHGAGALRHRPQDWQRSNVEGMARLLAGLREPSRIVFASSRSVYAPAAPGVLLGESSPLAPRDGYGASKLAAETLLRESRHDGVACRLTTLFGRAPRGDCPSLPNKAVRSFRNGECVRLVEHDVDVDYLAVSDAARLLVAILLDENVREPAINIAGPRRSLHRLVEHLAANCDKASGGAPRIVRDYPAGTTMNCLDTGLLRQRLPGFEFENDDAAGFS